MKLIIALHKVFKRDGQTLQEFKAETTSLTEKDRQDFVEMFNREMPELGGVEL